MTVYRNCFIVCFLDLCLTKYDECAEPGRVWTALRLKISSVCFTGGQGTEGVWIHERMGWPHIGTWKAEQGKRDFLISSLLHLFCYLLICLQRCTKLCIYVLNYINIFIIFPYFLYDLHPLAFDTVRACFMQFPIRWIFILYVNEFRILQCEVLVYWVTAWSLFRFWAHIFDILWYRREWRLENDWRSAFTRHYRAEFTSRFLKPTI